jgi:hypothetical protein
LHVFADQDGRKVCQPAGRPASQSLDQNSECSGWQSWDSPEEQNSECSGWQSWDSPANFGRMESIESNASAVSLKSPDLASQVGEGSCCRASPTVPSRTSVLRRVRLIVQSSGSTLRSEQEFAPSGVRLRAPTASGSHRLSGNCARKLGNSEHPEDLGVTVDQEVPAAIWQLAEAEAQRLRRAGIEDRALGHPSAKERGFTPSCPALKVMRLKG